MSSFSIVGSSGSAAYLAGVDNNQQLLVIDSSVKSAVDTNKTAVDAVATGVASVKSAIEINKTAVDAVATAVSGDLLVKNVSGGTLSVSAPAISAVSSVEKNKVTVSNGVTETTNAIDLNTVKSVALMGNLSDTTGQLIVQASVDDSTYYTMTDVFIYIDSSGDFYKSFDIDARYIKVSYTNGSGASQDLSLSISYKV